MAYTQNRLDGENATGAGFSRVIMTKFPRVAVGISYDAWGRAASVSENAVVTARHEYDALGRHIQETIDGDTINSYHDGAHVGEEYSGSTLLSSFAFSPAGRPIFRRAHVSSARWVVGRLWGLADAEHSTIAVTKDDGSVYRRYAYDQDGLATVSGTQDLTVNGQIGWHVGFEHLHRGWRFELMDAVRETGEAFGVADAGGGNWYNP